MADDCAVAGSVRRPVPFVSTLGRAGDALILKAAARMLARTPRGRVRLQLPSGRSQVLGASDGIEASLTLHSFAPFWRAVRRGSIGLGESYMRGEFETRDLGELFRFFLDNRPHLDSAGRGLFGVRMPDRIAHRLRANSKAGSRRNISAHYDLGNEFYRHWLDASMTYSSALYRDPAMTLEAAQAAKIDAVLHALAPETGGPRSASSILEIGFGWGSFAEAAARAGHAVTGLTLSRAQYDYSRDRLAAAGLADRTSLRIEDYRDAKGTFDHIVSIEMIEAVGEEHWPRYFSTLHDRLRPGGSAVIQAITIDEARFARYRRKPDFIQAYIFPGGMLPTVETMRREAAAAGLAFVPVETFAASYAITLREWRARFERAWPEIAALGFDERFRKMWLYYLTYCEVGFERGAIDVGLFRLERPLEQGARP